MKPPASITARLSAGIAFITLWAFASCSKQETPASSSSPEDSNSSATAENTHGEPSQTISADTPISFNLHIQPILSANCYHCHGPDSGTRLPEDEPYRLDNVEGAFQVRENGKPNIIKGDPDNSYLIKLMESKDPDEVMPIHPSKSPHGKTLDPADIALVRRWVKEGAVFEDHWAYISPKKHPLPEVQLTSWTRNPIDFFILRKLEQQQLQPNPDEDKARLLRRLSFDLTGLPPTAAELNAFTSDNRDFETVYAEKVDALLKTDAYAENYTRHWLDVARYADTHGIHNDNYRSIWPYRDWVINAFRSNMKFDQFTREQIAGDMMPQATIEQKIATGFHRCLPTTGEGGAIAEEYLAIYAQDRVNTTAATWLGITAGCAACHDHKFDAISTKENYQLAAFFRNTPMSALDQNNANHPPNILVPQKNDRSRYKQLTAKILSSKSQLKKLRMSEASSFTAWLQKIKNQPPQPSATLAGNLVNLPLNDKTKGVNHPTYFSKSPLNWSKGLSGDAVRFTGGNYINLGNTGDFERNQAFSYGAWIKSPHNISGGIIAKMHTQKSHRGYDLWAEQGKLAVHLIHAWPQNYIKVTTKKKFPADQWIHVLVSYDGSNKPEGIKIYINGKSTPLTVNANKLTKTIKTDAPLLLGSRHLSQPFHNGHLQHFQLYGRVLTAKEVLKISTAGRILSITQLAKNNPKQLDQIRSYYFSNINPKTIEKKLLLDRLIVENTAIEKRGVRSLVMQEKANSKPTSHILIRGQYANKGKETLSPNTPASLPPMTKDMPKNRLGLAIWLTDPRNPLPARVTVNRYWSYLFGSGIVETNNDFGVMGARPTHPQLLDWLATDFVEHQWDLHHLLKQMVMSSTYRQSAVLSKIKNQRDPLNKYYARSPRYRLDGEQIRDLALSSSALLHQHIGGPPVKPYQPINIWEAVAMKSSNTRFYKQDNGNKLYRRSLYTFWKRSAPHPSMQILDAPTREESCVQRELTNTPLQAFVLMNDPQFVESSRQLAALALQQASSTEDRINFITLRLLSRTMTPDEITIIKTTLQKVSISFKSKPAEAKKLISVGETKAPKNLNPTELASWTVIANQLLNMDETLNK